MRVVSTIHISTNTRTIASGYVDYNKASMFFQKDQKIYMKDNLYFFFKTVSDAQRS
jgi:hypothetical protein